MVICPSLDLLPVCVCLLLLVSRSAQMDMTQTLYDVDDYTHHPCNRACEQMSPARLCQYKWVVESYWTLSKACLNCPFNQSDCFGPHCISTDGVQRGIISVNRRLPGPPIEVCQGDMIEVKLYNELSNSEGTSVHWHGILQSGTPYMDGVSMITQCPIPAHTSFTYRFRALDAGTHYWHGHAGMHRADGMFGAIVVRQPPSQDPHYALYDHDLSEHVIIVNDWWNRFTLPAFLEHYHNRYNDTPYMMLINGMGAHQEFKDGNSTYYTPRASFTVEGGKRYRFRVISNAVADCPIQVSVDGHTMTVIASDGEPIEPFTTDSFDILNGERYDFILHADKTATLRNFWIRARGLLVCAVQRAHQVALLHYTGAPDMDPPELTDWDSSIRGGILLNPWNFPVSSEQIEISRMRAELPDSNDGVLTSVPDKKFYLGMDLNPVNWPKLHNPDFYPITGVPEEKAIVPIQINRITFTTPPSPPLSQYDDVPQDLYCNEFTVQRDCSQEWCGCTHKIDVALGDLVELIVLDEGLFLEANHPVHLHGHRFRVVAMGKLGVATTVEEVKALDERGEIIRSTSRAPHKDSVTVPDGGYVVLRFRANNPGVWLFHCHVDEHMHIGMGMVIQVGTKHDFPKPPRNFPTCGSWDELDHHDDDDDDGNDYDVGDIRQPILVQCINPPNGAGSLRAVSSDAITVVAGALTVLKVLASTLSSVV